MYIWNNFLTKLIFFKLFAVNKITKLAFVNLEKDLRCFQIIILCLCNSYVLLYYKRYDLYNIIRNIWWSFVRNVHYVQIPWEIHILFWNSPVAVVFEILDNDIILKEKYNNVIIINSIYKHNLQTIFSTTTLGFFAF